MALKSNPKEAAEEMAKSLRAVFKKYTLSSRVAAWEGIVSGKGEKEISKILRSPSKPVTGFRGLSFREWLKTKV